ncbi:hypothetical protein G3N55_12205, partial [Dissulfurirhabdus thermomarina]|nr:hypothetical protein [Dissulfurirhabdus thermomarina]
GRVRARDKVGLWIAHLLVQARRPGARVRSRFLGREGGDFGLGPVADPLVPLAGLVSLFREGWRRPVPFFPESSLAFAEAAARSGDRERALAQARRCWEGSPRRPGEGADPWNRLCHRGFPDDEDFAAVAAAVFGPMMEAVER